jgi:transcriptional regulator with XRE-family HTH domain
MLPTGATEEFQQWLKEQMKARGWSMRETSIKAGLSEGRISQIMRGDPPGMEVCIALAGAFDVQLELVLYLAGYPVRDPRAEYDAMVGGLADWLSGLPLDRRVKLIKVFRSIAELIVDS